MQRLIIAVIVSFLGALALGPLVIPALRRLRVGQTVRTDGPRTHLKKQGIPTMGGIMMWAAICVTALIFAPGASRFKEMLVLVGCTTACGLIGFADDYIKVVKKRSMGLRGLQKILGQIIIGLGVALYCYFHPSIGSTLVVPFFNATWDLGVFYIPFAAFCVVAMTNSSNLLDGVDGLLAGVTTLTMAVMALLALFIATAARMADLPFASAVFAGVVAGACLGFLRYNSFPAKVIMGDTGSMALGGAVIAVALFTRTALVIPIVGIMYVLSSLSDIIQIGSVKLRGKRVFRMAPLHHHFELGGASETQVVAGYMMATAIMGLITLLSLS